VPALELEAVDMDAPPPLEAARVPLAHDECDRGEDERHDENLDQKPHRCTEV
jgi:hypothetical protein